MKTSLEIKLQIVIALTFFLLSVPVWALTPQVNYQGKLTNSLGKPLNDPSVNMTFTLWTDEMSTDPADQLWTENQTVEVNDGIYNVMLGSTTTLPEGYEFGNNDLWLEVTVNGETLVPRTRLSTVPASLWANDADSLDGFDSTDFLSISGGTLTGSLHVESDDGALFGGTLYTGTIPATGAGSRMMWYPKKAAFRSGQAYSSEWDDVNIGYFSTAMGDSTTASDYYTTAIGRYTVASGYTSTAMGGFTEASGTTSTAMGSSTVASGSSSTAMGHSTTASGNTSTAMGHSTIASETYSTAMGFGTTASGYTSTSMGYYTTASGSSAIAMGRGPTASGSSSIAMGRYTAASGYTSTAMGAYTAADSLYETVIGSFNTLAVSPSAGSWVATDRMFTIGNGTNSDNRSNALTVLKNGNVGIGTSTPAEILTVAGTIESTTGGVKFPDGTTQISAASGDITAVTAGTGLSGGGTSGDVTLDLEVPLSLTGSSATGLLSSFNYGTGYGIFASASGDSGRGLFASASGTSGRGVYGWASNSGDVINYGGYFQAAGTEGRGVYGYATGSSGKGVYGYATGDSGRGVWGAVSGANGRGVTGSASYTGNASNFGGFFQASGTTGTGVYGWANGTNGIGVHGKATNTGDFINYGGYFEASGLLGRGVCSVGSAYDFYALGGGVNYYPFTGAHEVQFAKDFPSEIIPGMIVSVTGRTAVRIRENGQTSISSTLPSVTLSNKAMDKAVLGVLVSEGTLPEDHWYSSPQEGERFGAVNALGEGRMWVSDINGNIEAGDYITSSPVPGYGELQNDDLLHSYTVGKAIENVEWETVTDTVEFQGTVYKVYLIAVVYTSG